MKPTSARRVAADILTDWAKTKGKIDEVRDRHLGKVELDERDRGLVTEIVYGVTRNQAALHDELAKRVNPPLNKLKPGLLPILEVALYQLRYLDRIPDHAAVNEAVDHARFVAGNNGGGLVNAVLRSAIRQPQERPVDAFTHKGTPLHRWRERWRQQWGDEKTDTLVHFYKTVPPVGLRRNLLRTESDEQWHEILTAEGVEFEVLPDWPGSVYARDVRPAELPSFEQGVTTVQDPAPSLSVRVLDPRPGERVLDMCCAPGGKTALIWELMRGEGTLIAVDKSMKRNKLTRETLQRLGHDAVEVVTEDVVKYEAAAFDRVLIDVPCSGTGVAHRRADLLVNHSPMQVDHMAKVQRQLLNRAAKLVKPGGVLVYSTCSLEPAENEKRVSAFDKRFAGEFEREDLLDSIPQAIRGEIGIAATWPPRDKVDGAFVTRWRRTL
ncbi:16S rRNA (cytosine(967)-C(5))-methyltransferase RsmB [bacterium]|nr:16S rRNA (cytosine(967)-C(5))-methyltransferase RsmB [bacterium]